MGEGRLLGTVVYLAGRGAQVPRESRALAGDGGGEKTHQSTTRHMRMRVHTHTHPTEATALLGEAALTHGG